MWWGTAQVSKWFSAITYDHSIWRCLYASSCLPRPPGPFSFQSTAYLEQALVRAERLAQSWTTQPMRDASYIELQIEQQPRSHIELLGGRWIIGCESRSRFVLHDINIKPESQRQVIWEQEELVVNWKVCSVASKEGQCLVYVLLGTEVQDTPYPVWYVCVCYCRSMS